MDLVTNYFYTMFLTDVVHALQFLLSPDAARRIVWVAEQEEGGFFIGALGFEIDEIDLKGWMVVWMARVQTTPGPS